MTGENPDKSAKQAVKAKQKAYQEKVKSNREAAKVAAKKKADALKESKKASAAKVKADQQRIAADNAARSQWFSGDSNAANDVRQMTTPQGYSPDPLKGRSPQPAVKKKLDKNFIPDKPPKFR